METPLTPMDFARRARKLHPDREAVVDGTRRFTYRQFLDRCDRWSAALRQLGVKPGDRIATIAPNSHQHLECFYGIPQIGGVTVPINFRLKPDDFAYIIEHSGARVVCVHADFLHAVESIRARLPGVEHFVSFEATRPGWHEYEALLVAAPPEVPAVERSESDLISLNYTSGTTARPKGVMITHRNAWVNCIGELIHLRLTCADRFLWTVPMFHANGWTFVWTVTAAGARHVCLRKVEPRLVFEAIAREQISLFGAAPTILIGLANAPAELQRLAPRGVRVITAGAPPAAATIERIEAGLGWEVTQVYGLTEVSPLISLCEPRPEHAGLAPRERARIKARQGVEFITSGDLRIVDEQGLDVPRDGATVGEIIVRGNVVMAGYYRDAESTARAIRDGWFHTGDAAVVHPDGYAEIRDRLKDVIISGGENISSVEVEGALLRHPAVQEVAVVGMPHPKWGEAPHAFVVVRAGALVSGADLLAFAREQLAHFKVPQAFSFLPELPKTATGKIQKFVLRGGRPNLSAQ